MNSEDKNKINSLFKKVVTMGTIDAFQFLNSVEDDPEIVEQVIKLLSDSQTRTIFLEGNPELENILQPISLERDLVGQSIGNIELIQLLGKGGMGEVYLGEDKQLQRKVAVKTIRGIYRPNENARDRFRREALILSKLNHENICKIYNIIEIDDIDFLILEYVDGTTLDKYPLYKLSYAEKLKLAKSLLNGLLVAHNEDIVHRDIKPDNIIINKDGSIKILDFGISASLKQQSNQKKTDMHPTLPISKTAAGSIVGTLGYMSPEQATLEEISTASDIYSLGIIFQDIFSSQPAHSSDLSNEQLLKRAQKGETDEVQNVPADLTQLINRMKARKPASRPTAFDAIEKLDKIINKPKRRIKQFSIAALLLLSVLAFSKYTYDLKQQKLEAESARNIAEQARLEAETAKDEAEQVTAFLESFFTASNPYNQQGKEITASEILEDGAKRVDEELEDKPQVLIRIKNIIGNVYGKRGQSDLARNQYEESLKLFESHSIKDAKLNIITLVQLSEIEFFANDYTRMRDVLLMAKKIAEENLLYDKAEYLPLRFNLAAAYEELGEHDRAISMFDELLQIYLQDEKKFRTAIINTYNFVGLIKADAGNNEAAEQDLLKALSYLDKNVVTDSELETTLYHNLSTVYKDLKQYQKAIDSLFKVVDMRTKILGEQHPLLAITYDNISRNYRLLEEYDTARKYNDLAIKIFQDTKTINIDYGTVLGNKAMILIDAEQNYSDAEIYTLKAIDVLKQVFKERDHRFIANEITLLGKIYLLQGRNNKALEQTQEAINMYNRINYPTHLIATQAWLNLAEIYDKLNQKSKELETYHTLLQKLLQESRRDEEAIKEVTEKISFLSKE
ncbi:MAG TPA: serine/threonine-protein kinase [Gammaproteobacteria bacterium]|nr:serine/threonine protein kinase [Xanthomonadales bacterium]MCB1594384.1 serine/threonine protein kinase [Xanthomonadales bacterium]HOP22237.1 serine/threonine-protein kinase [Gammaproteobacteria bacterium]HPQ87265.1 serine/threonine-protein kinase [Gammaproteobacteria bacterium]